MEQEKYIPALGYDFLTAYYDLAIKITMPEKKFRRLLVEEINPQKNEQILEFGFGTGQNLLLVHKANPNIKLEGLDIDPKVKAIAERKLAKIKLQFHCIYTMVVFCPFPIAVLTKFTVVWSFIN